jgi:thiamine-monophosphate kinase
MKEETAGSRVRDIGEQGLLRRLQSFCPAELVGDDAAVLTPSPGRAIVVTTDVLVDGVHFSNPTTSPEDAGWRAAAANLSDLAAMGASPLGITVGLAIPGEVSVNWVERLYQGMVECLQQYGASIVGGDVVRSPTITVAITAFGEAEPTQIIRRSAAQPGDAILVTGPHGSSRAGLELLLHPELGERLGAGDRAAFIQAHQRPNPRLDVLALIRGVGSRESGVGSQEVEGGGDAETGRHGDAERKLTTNNQPLTTDLAQNSKLKTQNSKLSSPLTSHIAGMDSSDGLADAIVQICAASKVGARVERSQIPVLPALVEWVGEEQALEWALYGGEDFELVLCLPYEAAQELVQTLGNGAAIVGTITSEPGIYLIDTTGKYPEVSLTLEQGFQHFK